MPRLGDGDKLRRVPEVKLCAPAAACCLPLPIVLYDDECGLCSAAVQYLLEHDRRSRLRFAALQSETGRAALARHGYQTVGSVASGQGRAIDSLSVVVDRGLPTERMLIESEALFYVVRCLGGWRGLLAALGRLFPRAFADCAYRAIAQRRHRFTHHALACRLLNAETDARVLPGQISETSQARKRS